MKARDEREQDRVMRRWTEKKRALPLGQFGNIKRMFTAVALWFAGGDVETALPSSLSGNSRPFVVAERKETLGSDLLPPVNQPMLSKRSDMMCHWQED